MEVCCETGRQQVKKRFVAPHQHDTTTPFSCDGPRSADPANALLKTEQRETSGEKRQTPICPLISGSVWTRAPFVVCDQMSLNCNQDR